MNNVTQQQLEDVREAAELLDGVARDAVKLRDNPDHLRGRARQRELYCRLSIMEVSLHAASMALRDMAGQGGE